MPAPWDVEEMPRSYCIVDAEGKRLAYVYGLDEKQLAAAGHERLTKDEARRISANIAKLPDLLGDRYGARVRVPLGDTALTLDLAGLRRRFGGQGHNARADETSSVGVPFASQAKRGRGAVSLRVCDMQQRPSWISGIHSYGLNVENSAGHQRLTKDEARRVAANIAKLPGRLGERKQEYQMNVERKDAEESVKKMLDAVPAGGTSEHDLEALTELFGGAARARLQTLANECACTAEFDDKANKIIFKKGKG